MKLLQVERMMSIIKTSTPKRTRAKLRHWNKRTLAIAQARLFRLGMSSSK